MYSLSGCRTTSSHLTLFDLEGSFERVYWIIFEIRNETSHKTPKKSLKDRRTIIKYGMKQLNPNDTSMHNDKKTV